MVAPMWTEHSMRPTRQQLCDSGDQMGVHRQNQSAAIDERAKPRREFGSKLFHDVLLVDSIELAQGWCLGRVEPELELDELVAVREVRGD